MADLGQMSQMTQLGALPSGDRQPLPSRSPELVSAGLRLLGQKPNSAGGIVG